MKAQAQQGEWTESLDRNQATLESIPPALLHTGPSYTTQTKTGEKLTTNSQFYYFKGMNFEACKESNNLRLYMFTKNEAGEVIGTRVASIFEVNTGVLECKSKIIVRDKGQGLASPIEKSFIQTLQHFADKTQKRIIWRVENQNLERLNKYRKEPDHDPAKLAALEAEQERWQHLYGNGGKFGIERSRRIFDPSPVEPTTVDLGKKVRSTLDH